MLLSGYALLHKQRQFISGPGKKNGQIGGRPFDLPQGTNSAFLSN
jgi:hypothetical protein